MKLFVLILLAIITTFFNMYSANYMRQKLLNSSTIYMLNYEHIIYVVYFYFLRITCLIKNSFLVDLSATKENKEEQTDGPKQLEVMVFHHHAQKELPSSQLALLEAILNACKLNTTQVIIYSKNELLNNFIFASKFLQDAKTMRMTQQ